MKKDLIEIIKQQVAAGKDIPSAVIEYNFEVPKSKGLKVDSFYGVKARFNPEAKPDTVQLTYTM